MTTYVRNGGAWTQAQPRVRCDGEWKAGNLYVRCGGEWKQVYDTSEGALLAPESLAAGSVDHNSATLSWTNPTQSPDDPTQVQYRLAQLGAVWNEQDYPATSVQFSALDPSTEYLAQVRYIIRTNGVITGTSPIADVTFTTDAAPIGAPAEDPGGTGGDTIVPFTGTTTGTPGAPSTANGTWWEWKLELLSETALSWSTPNPPNTATSDDGLTVIYGEVSGSATQVSWDDGDLTAGRTYRVCRREVEDTTGNATADTFGSWVCGDPFPAPTDWGAACAGATGSSTVTGVTYVGDLTFRFPDACINADGEMIMRESVAGNQVIKGPGFFSFFTDADDEEGASSLTTQTSSPFLPSMAVPVNATITKGSDWSLVTRFRALAAFSGVNTRTYDIQSFGGGAVTFNLLESATGWTPSVKVLGDGGGFVTLTGSEIAYDSENTHTLALTWDADGTKTLYVDAVSADTSTGTDVYETVTSAGVVTSAPAYLMNMQQLGIDRVLTSGELEELTVQPAAVDGGISVAHQQQSQVIKVNCAVKNGGLVLVGTHHREGGTTNAVAMAASTYLDTQVALYASSRYDTAGVSDGAAALYTTTGTADATETATMQNARGAGLIAFDPGVSIQQSAAAQGTGDAMSVSLPSGPSGNVYVIMFTGGVQTIQGEPSAPAGWTTEGFSEQTMSGGYLARGWILSGTSQTWSKTLSGWTAGAGGWRAFIVEVG